MSINNSPKDRDQIFNDTFHKTVQVGDADKGRDYNWNEIGHLHNSLGIEQTRLMANEYITTDACEGQSGASYTQTWGGRYAPMRWQRDLGPQHDTTPCPPHPVLWERSYGHTRVTGSHALAAGTDCSWAFPGPKWRGHFCNRGDVSQFRGWWRLKWDKYI